MTSNNNHRRIVRHIYINKYDFALPYKLQPLHDGQSSAIISDDKLFIFASPLLLKNGIPYAMRVTPRKQLEF